MGRLGRVGEVGVGRLIETGRFESVGGVKSGCDVLKGWEPAPVMVSALVPTP